MEQLHRQGIKHHIGGASFTIEHTHQTEYDNMSRPHAHPHFELYYLLKGERIYFIDGNVFTMKKGDIMLVNPNDLHSSASSKRPDFEMIQLHFSLEFARKSQEEAIKRLLPFEHSRLLRLPLKEQTEVEHLLMKMISECDAESEQYVPYVRSLLTELLIRIYRCCQFMDDSLSSDRPLHHKISEITLYMRKNYPKPLTLEQVAEQFCISSPYLSRIFTKLTGFHFREYLQVIRIHEAKNRLATTKDSVQSIAEQVGFDHIAHFNKVFKKLSNTTPLKYRRQHQVQS